MDRQASQEPPTVLQRFLMNNEDYIIFNDVINLWSEASLQFQAIFSIYLPEPFNNKQQHLTNGRYKMHKFLCSSWNWDKTLLGQ